jgi:diacylglycerol kinase
MINLPKTIRSFKYALSGILYLFKTENNARVHLLAAITALVLGLWFHILAIEWALLSISIGMVCAAEAFNSAIEKICDVISIEKHPQIKIIKDVAAGAVLITAFAAVGVGVAIFGIRILVFLKP